jgi:ATP-dependent RNA helicase DDX35
LLEQFSVNMSLSFWKPGTVGPGSNLDRASQVEENIVPSAPGNSFLSTQGQLPISKHRECVSSALSTLNNIYIKGRSSYTALKNMELL